MTWAADYVNERLAGARIGSRAVKLAFDDPGLSAREHAFLLVIRSAFEQAADDDRRLFVGGAAGLLDEMRTEEIGAYRSLMDALEKRAALLDVLAQRLDPRRPFARVGEELEQPGAARARPRRRDLRRRASHARLGQPARAAAHGLREGASHRALGGTELSRFVEEIYGDD